MIVSAQISIYPLRQERLTPAIDAVQKALEAEGLKPEVGAMSTVVTGDSPTVFTALQHAFERVGAMGHAVMTVTVSNACPT